MELSQLASYAREKFHMEEQFKWPDYPGISVLTEPETGRQVALLIYEWDSESGTGIQRADIRCGRPDRDKFSEDVQIERPFLKRGSDWTGLVLTGNTDESAVYHLLDKAVADCAEWNFSISLKDSAPEGDSGNSGTPLLFHGTAIPPRTHISHKISASQPRSEKPSVISSGALQIPVKIIQMRALYQYGNYSFDEKCGNFVRQGKFMEDYEDNVPWNGFFRRYFPTYHDLNVPQLRGYFTWRAEVRRDVFHPVSTSLAYIYLYELLNGIGTSGPVESLRKMKEFETGFLDSGIGDVSMRGNLHRWMFEYAILKELPAETVRSLADPELLKEDNFHAALRCPEKHTDAEIFSALSHFDRDKLSDSPVITKFEEHGQHLFAEAWRQIQEHYGSNHETDFFTACFGKQMICPWHPLGNAIYAEEEPHPDSELFLDESRFYRCHQGNWYETRYEALYFDRDRLHAFVHETDRLLRKYLKTGRYLRPKETEMWTDAFVNPVIQKDLREKQEASRPRISIDFSRLVQIRSDAAVTRDSLLTEEETVQDADIFNADIPDTRNRTADTEALSAKPKPPTAGISHKGLSILPVRDGQDHPEHAEGPDLPSANRNRCGNSDLGDTSTDKFHGLDSIHLGILQKLLAGESVRDALKAHRLMPSVVTDTINEALFDEIGDSVLECDDDKISVLEDYREDLEDLLKDSPDSGR